jgi:hypothetical protein
LVLASVVPALGAPDPEASHRGRGARSSGQEQFSPAFLARREYLAAQLRNDAGAQPPNKKLQLTIPSLASLGRRLQLNFSRSADNEFQP